MKIVKKIFLSIALIFVIILAVLLSLIFISSNQYYPSPIECIEQRNPQEELKIDSVLFKYENDNQGFYIMQTKSGHFYRILFRIRDYNGQKFYNFRKSYLSGGVDNLVYWYDMGDFEYFIADDEESIPEHSDGKAPTVKATIYYKVPNQDEKGESVIYLIDTSTK